MLECFLCLKPDTYNYECNFCHLSLCEPCYQQLLVTLAKEFFRLKPQLTTPKRFHLSQLPFFLVPHILNLLYDNNIPLQINYYPEHDAVDFNLICHNCQCGQIDTHLIFRNQTL